MFGLSKGFNFNKNQNRDEDTPRAQILSGKNEKDYIIVNNIFQEGICSYHKDNTQDLRGANSNSSPIIKSAELPKYENVGDKNLNQSNNNAEKKCINHV